MATIEERLVAYQVVRSLNRAAQDMLDVSGKMKLAKDDKEKEALKLRCAGVVASN